MENEVPEFSFESDEEGNIVITGVMESLYNLESGELIVSRKILGRHVKGIGDYAFKESYKFDSLVLKEGIEEIGTGAFSWAGVTYVTLPSTLKKIGDFAFEANSNMESLEIPESVSYVGNSAKIVSI